VNSGASVSVGDVIYLHDVLDTAFSAKSVWRPWMVAAVLGQTVRAIPRSSTSSSGVLVPQTALAAFTTNGRFCKTSRSISLTLASSRQNAGPLPEPYKTQVLEQYRRRRRKRPSPPPGKPGATR
jgi:hypothetical protein